MVLPIKGTRPICTRSSCVRNARNGVSAMRLLRKKSRKPVLFVTELLQGLGNRRANERKPRRNPSQQQSKIDLPSHTASAWQAIGGSRDSECHARKACATQFANPTPSPRLLSRTRERRGCSRANRRHTNRRVVVMDQEQLVRRRGGLGASALVAGGAQSFHLSPQDGHSGSNPFVLLRGP